MEEQISTHCDRYREYLLRRMNEAVPSSPYYAMVTMTFYIRILHSDPRLCVCQNDSVHHALLDLCLHLAFSYIGPQSTYHSIRSCLCRSKMYCMERHVFPLDPYLTNTKTCTHMILELFCVHLQCYLSK